MSNTRIDYITLEEAEQIIEMKKSEGLHLIEDAITIEGNYLIFGNTPQS